MILVSREVSDLKGEFEGGSSFSISWLDKLRQGAEAVLDNINPETLKRRAPIYGGLAKDLWVYYCPQDVLVPSRLYTRDLKEFFDYVPPAQFYRRQVRQTYTIEYVNGIRFLVTKRATNGTVLTVDSMEEVGTKTGPDLSINTYNILPGASAALQGTFTDAAYTVADTLGENLDISSLLEGIVLIPVYYDNQDDVEHIKLRLKSSADDYFEMSSTQNSVGDYLADGQNMVRFELAGATIEGGPDSTAINSWELEVKMKTGKTQTVIIGKITVQKSAIFFLEYYSNRMFVDRTTGAWKDTPANNDYINLNRDALGILHFETCRLVVQSAAFDRIDSAESQRFDTNLARKYDQYYGRHPSSEQPLTYSIMADIPIDPIIGPFAEFDERVGDNQDSETTTNAAFAYNETPSGTINGITASFTLSHAPSPRESLQLWLNGQFQTQGVEYTLAGNTITFGVPPDISLAGTPFVAFYRYNP